MKNSLYLALQKSIRDVRQGVSIEECLSRYPEYASDLEPLLRSTVTGPGNDVPAMPAPARARVRLRVMSEWDRRHQPQRNWWRFPSLSLMPRLIPRWAAVAAAVVVVVLVGGAGTAAASQNAMPGSTLYPVKEFREAAQLWFATSPEQKVSMYSRLVEERAREISTLAEQGQEGPSVAALGRLEQHLNGADQVIRDASQGEPAAVDRLSAPLVQSLEDIVAGPAKVSEVVDKAVASSPGTAYPCLEHSRESIQAARQQVRSALENLGHTLPSGAATVAGSDFTFCPQ